MTAVAEEVPRAFRRHFAEHNKRVILLSLLSVILVAIVWALFYGLFLLLILLYGAIRYGIEAEAPRDFPALFAAGALGLLIVALLAGWVRPYERPVDRRRWWEVGIDLVLLLPRATVSIWKTLSAYQFLDEREIRLAWQLLQRLCSERQLQVQAVPQEIPDEKDRRRILTALQLAEIVDIHSRGEELFLVWRDEEAKSLCQPRSRLRLPR